MKWYFYNRVIKEAYRNKKRKAAIWILERISKQKGGILAGTGIGVGETHTILTNIDNSIANFYFIHELQTESNFSKSLIKDAVFYLESAGYVEKDNPTITDYYKQEIKITKVGIAALNDEVIEDEIYSYKNDIYYSYSRWWLPILAIIISIFSLYFTMCKKSSGYNISVQQLNPQLPSIDTNKKMPPALQADTPNGKGAHSRDSTVK